MVSLPAYTLLHIIVIRVRDSSLLVFKVAYQHILQLTYVEDLLVALKTLFVKLYKPFLTAFVSSLHAINSGKVAALDTVDSWNFAKAFEGWDDVFGKLLKGLEDKAALVCNSF